MSQKKKVAKVSKNPKVLAGSKAKVKEPKFKLLTYTLKAVIPTGQFANIQPEITVQAATIQDAERATMPYIESLFAKYRNGGSTVQVQVSTPVDPIKPVAQPAQAVPQKPQPVAPQPTAQAQGPVTAQATVPEKVPEASIVLTVPFNRAKSAVESCTSKEALRLVSDQITKSTKLTQEEKNTLTMLVSDKGAQLDGAK